MVYSEGIDLIVEMNEEAAQCVVDRKPLHFSDEVTRVADLAGPIVPLEEDRDAPGL